MIETMDTNSLPPVHPAAISLCVFHQSHQFNTEKLIKQKKTHQALILWKDLEENVVPYLFQYRNPQHWGFFFFCATAPSGPGPPHE